ncbi:MAG: nucleoside hydrolase [bacterium]
MIKMQTTPVILDTDPGTDIDDTWALLYLLRCPELDLRLVTTATGDTTYRAKLTARLLELTGRADVAVGIGRPGGQFDCTLQPWAADYDLARYPGTIHANAAEAIVRTIMDSPEPVTVIAIAPLTNLGDALLLEPRIAQKARFVGMHGSIARNFDGAEGAIAEWNVIKDIPAAQRVFQAPWDKTITPLDTCGQVRLSGEQLRRVERASSADPDLGALMECYRIWRDFYGPEARVSGWLKGQPEQHTSILFDCVAVYLAFCRDGLRVEDLNLRVADDGFLRQDATGQPVHCALDWLDLPAFREHLMQRLLKTLNT